MSKHTPGPWGCTYTSNHAHDYRLSHPNGAPLPINAPSNDRSEQRANAALIAAAPDLLEALEWISENHYAHHDIMVEVARAAIAAARGEG
jgi:hypothetical protein